MLYAHLVVYKRSMCRAVAVTFNLVYQRPRVEFLRELLHVVHCFRYHTWMSLAKAIPHSQRLRCPLIYLVWRGNWCKHDVNTFLLHFQKLLDELHGLVTLLVKYCAHNFRFDCFFEGGKLGQAALDGLLNDVP